MNKTILKTVIADNQAELPRYQVVPRNFEFAQNCNYVLVGIRRAGKSYLLYQRIQQLLQSGTPIDEILYVNFEDERLAGMQAEDLNQLLETHLEIYGKKPILFLDEIQNISGWEKFARRMADTKHQVYITGSNAKMLSRDIQTTLGGRFITINVFPYNFTEFLSANSITLSKTAFSSTEERATIQRFFNNYLSFGGFPESAQWQVKRDYLNSVYHKIYLGDIALRHSIDNSFALRVLFKKLAESVGQPISFNRLANIISSTGAKVSTNTIINYTEYASDAWLITPIHNIASKLVEKESTPKYYFSDNGILNLFLLNDESSLLENLVAITLLRKYGREGSVFFYNKNVEVDFYIPDTETAIQVCWSMSDRQTAEREISALQAITKVLPCKQLTIVTRDEEETMQLGELTIHIVPVWKLLLSIEDPKTL